MPRITMPQLGESVTEGTIGRWLKKPGERVERDEPIVEVITDKVNAEIPSPVAGVLERISAAEGTVVAVGQEIAFIAVPGEAPEAEAEEPPARAAAGPPSTSVPAAVRPGGEAPGSTVPRSSPLVRRLAREHGIDLRQIRGTGLGGRVTHEDIERYLGQGGGAAPPPDSDQDEVVIPTPIRRTIAERMVRSVREIPHAWLMIEADVTGLVRLREGIKESFRQREGVDLTYLPFVLKATAESLRENPIVNATWTDGKIILKRAINLGVAIALDDGLVVPVIPRADQKSVTELAHALADLVERARAGKLTLADMEGGTFTVNNTGAFGSVISQPIINYPQAAILTMEAITRRPVVLDEAIAIRSRVNLCLAFDHRVMDGAVAGRFLQSVRRRLEAWGPDSPVP
ncbi:MAG TPA: dihydrolipoamide acetyltransferase family protein [Chloroflexota bacterium]|nr:dihydrolipoamide acetyltransferase family protein [Chloroflexota bacterium]